MFWIPPRKRSLYDPVFANNTWAQIIRACQNKEVPETWAVGNQKTMTINGTDYAIDIIGKNHDDYADGSGKAPLTFQMHDCYAGPYRMNSSNTTVGGWTNCDMRTTHLPALFALLPSEIQNGIREVNKLTSAGNGASTINTTADNLFLLSEIEVFGSKTYSYNGEGAQYEYYKAGDSKIKNRINSPTIWGERSPGTQSGIFCYVSTSGSPDYIGASYLYGVAFGFCF